MARLLVAISFIAGAGTSLLACGVLLAGSGSDDPPTESPPSGPDKVLEASIVDAPFGGGDGSSGGDETSTAKPVDAGCPQCASGHCPSGPALCDPLVFVTAEDFAGDFSEVADAGGTAKLDVACNRSAAAAGVKGYYKAWVSADGEGSSPSTRLAHTQRPYRRRDGLIVVPTYEGFLRTSGLDNRISLTAGGAVVTEKNVWTGTWHNLQAETRDCDGWSNGTSTGETGVVGITTCPAAGVCPPDHWTFRSTEACNARARVYCIEQVP